MSTAEGSLWQPVDERDVPKGIKFTVSNSADQGQMIEKEYGFVGAATPVPYKRVRDRSVGPTWRYYRKAS